ncbi:DUF4010 domain-containing protein [Deinococcus planocerae]|uniref:DUF4010 domain-containing protein n=1 Tax=Deinococcus planocerae TaxID=1737569 RepID=UPI000C7F1334|nr:DUF4010 domain-containing protein [Deinococcus planocerae]
MNAFGHVLGRAVGPRYGLALAGCASGFVSSLATVAALGSRARADERSVRGAVAGATASSVATIVQAAVLIGTISPALLAGLVWPLSLGGLATLAYAAVQAWRADHTPTGAGVVTGRAFDVRAALGFAALVSLVAFLAELVGRALGPARGAVPAHRRLPNPVSAHPRPHPLPASPPSERARGCGGSPPSGTRIPVTEAGSALLSLFSRLSGPRAYAATPSARGLAKGVGGGSLLRKVSSCRERKDRWETANSNAPRAGQWR